MDHQYWKTTDPFHNLATSISISNIITFENKKMNKAKQMKEEIKPKQSNIKEDIKGR